MKVNEIRPQEPLIKRVESIVKADNENKSKSKFDIYNLYNDNKSELYELLEKITGFKIGDEVYAISYNWMTRMYEYEKQMIYEYCVDGKNIYLVLGNSFRDMITPNYAFHNEEDAIQECNFLNETSLQ